MSPQFHLALLIYLTWFPSAFSHFNWLQKGHDAQGTRHLATNATQGSLNCLFPYELPFKKLVLISAYEPYNGTTYEPWYLLRDNVIYLIHHSHNEISAYLVDNFSKPIGNWRGFNIRDAVLGDYYIYVLSFENSVFKLHLLRYENSSTFRSFEIPENDNRVASLSYENGGYTDLSVLYVMTSTRIYAFLDDKDNPHLMWSLSVSDDLSYNSTLAGKVYVDPIGGMLYVSDTKGVVYAVTTNGTFTQRYAFTSEIQVTSIFGYSITEKALYAIARKSKPSNYGYLKIYFNDTAGRINPIQFISMEVPLAISPADPVVQQYPFFIESSCADNNLAYYTTSGTLVAINLTTRKILWNFHLTFDSWGLFSLFGEPVLLWDSSLLIGLNNRTHYGLIKISACQNGGYCNLGNGINGPCTCSGVYYGWTCESFCDGIANCSGHGVCINGPYPNDRMCKCSSNVWYGYEGLDCGDFSLRFVSNLLITVGIVVVSSVITLLVSCLVKLWKARSVKYETINN